MNLLTFTLSILMISLECYCEHYGNDSRVIEIEELPKSVVLSRRKRFLIFPDGSSFQLVFCTQNHGYLQIGDIVWFGNTAALAWELPSDPTIFNIFRDHNKLLGGNRRSDNKHILYVDERGKVIGKVPYRRRPIVNPAFAKRSVDLIPTKKTISIKKMHALNKEANCLKNLHENSIQLHREQRKSLYMKIEKFVETLGWNGRECVLRLLCESRRERKRQGTFLEEILRATFTLPRGPAFDEDYHKQYDEAHGTDGQCAELYPQCEDRNGVRFDE